MSAAFLASGASGAELHVSPKGNDAADGSAAAPLKTISAAADRAQPGDVITVHAGVYRERIDPPRGGTADERRIVYQAAPGESVTIKGSEPVTGWQKVEHDTYRAILNNAFFGEFNPFADMIRGDWFNRLGRDHHTGAVYLNGHWLTEAATKENVMAPAGNSPLWFAEVGDKHTTIWAQFPGVDPNEQNVEINVRQSVFYPSKPGVNYVTVRGFTLEHAATPWAPPTAEQVGLIGVHWSKGWIIENNTIRYSTCTGVTLGKHGDQFDNTSQDSAEGYVETIHRALARGWSKENIGHHVVRNNHISHCEQAGIVGSMGPAFSLVEGNVIHDIHVRRLFTGAEQAGIKFHGAVDTLIRRNHIYRVNRGIWLDWMTQGTRVTQNLLHDNGHNEDLFVEVNHGPFLIDNNIFLSKISLKEMSEGGAYAHNLFAGRILLRKEHSRLTPYLQPHGVGVAGLKNIAVNDERWANNLFIAPAGLSVYDGQEAQLKLAGNVFMGGAKPAAEESSAIVEDARDPRLKLSEESGEYRLSLAVKPQWPKNADRPLVTTQWLGAAVVPEAPFEQPDGSPYRLDTDYFGKPRNAENPFPGPFAQPDADATYRVWPVE